MSPEGQSAYTGIFCGGRLIHISSKLSEKEINEIIDEDRIAHRKLNMPTDVTYSYINMTPEEAVQKGYLPGMDMGVMQDPEA